jgi:predicted branched-subunit amino acid permease
MAPLLEVTGLKKILAAHITIDESTAVALAYEKDGKRELRKAFWWTGVGVFIFWNIFTAIGALSAGLLDDPAQWGLDTAVPAAFLALLWPQLKNRQMKVIALLAMALALALSPILSAGIPIIATVAIAIIAGWRDDE